MGRQDQVVAGDQERKKEIETIRKFGDKSTPPTCGVFFFLSFLAHGDFDQRYRIPSWSSYGSRENGKDRGEGKIMMLLLLLVISY